MDKLPRLTTELCDLATQAGEKIMNFYEEGADVTWKEDASHLTSDADNVLHDFLVESIRFAHSGSRHKCRALIEP
jgi:3'-phosphoadenosine 5'-phosphosulfate (PAPS) 3'-phosphatase